MKPQITTLKAKRLIGHSVEMSLINNKTHELFSGFMPGSMQIKNVMSPDVYEVMIYSESHFKNFSPNNSFIKWAAVEVLDSTVIPDGMASYILKGGKYAIFKFKGLPADIGEFMRHIFMEWLPDSGYVLDQRAHFNVLGESYKTNDPNSEEEVWIPIKE